MDAAQRTRLHVLCVVCVCVFVRVTLLPPPATSLHRKVYEIPGAWQAALVEQEIRVSRNDRPLVTYLAHKAIVEIVPLASLRACRRSAPPIDGRGVRKIQTRRGIVTATERAGVVDDSEEVVDQLARTTATDLALR